MICPSGGARPRDRARAYLRPAAARAVIAARAARVVLTVLTVLAVLALIAACEACRGEPARTPPADPVRAPTAEPADAARIADAQPDVQDSQAEEVHAAPHGSFIVQVALTDAGDAALTADALGALRLWLALDGTREPLVVRGGPVRQLALGRDGGELVAALLDPAGGLELLRFDAAGAVRGRARVPADPAAYEELAFAGGVFLARRSDHVIAALDARGQLRGRLVAEPGERITAVMARGPAAAAAIASGSRDGAQAVRRIELAGPGAPRWGESVPFSGALSGAFSGALAAPLAISPGGRRLAGLDGKTGDVVVVELAPKPRVVRRLRVARPRVGAGAGGFLDELMLVTPEGELISLDVPDAPEGAPGAPPDASGAPPDAPGAPPDARGAPPDARPGGGSAPDRPADRDRPRGRMLIASGLAVGDRISASGLGGALALTSVRETWFLAYRYTPTGVVHRAGSLFTLDYLRETLWLDARLRVVREAVLPVGTLLIDSAHAIEQEVAPNGGPGGPAATLVSYGSGRREPIGPIAPAPGEVIAYEPRTRTLAALAGGGREVRRWRLDLATAAIEPAGPALRVRREARIELFDPALADGVVAIAIVYSMLGVDGAAEIFVERAPGSGALAPGSGALAPVGGALAPASRVMLGNVSVLGFDRRGGIWSATGFGVRQITVHRAGRVAARFKVPADLRSEAVDPTGERLVLMGERAVVALGMDGAELWRRWAPGARNGAFSEDGKHVALIAQGGLLVLDAATGAVVTAGCGWLFGRLAETWPGRTVLGAPPLCAEGAVP
ncbi:MAG TPA: hypothetical protein VNO30_22500 [Kofleriaceae bacterium]|nr:hypothetical protein [Kofleriaceae bacterium]